MQLTLRIPVDFLHILPCSLSLLFSCSSGGSHGIGSNSLERVDSIFCREVDVTWLLNSFGALWRSSTTLCNPLTLWTSVQLCPSGGFGGTGGDFHFTFSFCQPLMNGLLVFFSLLVELLVNLCGLHTEETLFPTGGVRLDFPNNFSLFFLPLLQFRILSGCSAFKRRLSIALPCRVALAHATFLSRKFLSGYL